MNNRNKINSILGEYNHSQRILQEEKDLLQITKEHQNNILEAQKIVQVVASSVQESAHKQIASVVSKCLEAVFDEPYKFVISFERKRNKTEAQLTFVRDGKALEDPINESGGGVIDVAGFALRLASLILATPKRRKLLVLDEPFRFLSKEYTERMGECLIQLSKEMEIQIIMVTHNQDFIIGEVIRIE